ncbi:DUF6952 family protein [Sandaracinus amylolyticus]|uniref:DUF6952 family protein n=1 Tax=Sandaracinus amylolyticus TaxID=927083 RepID=UPI001F1FFAD8|nr:hypothetical protein [Sandaracinus amylolyticus]UJR80076.1 Hypothetical protein I5071_21200 [Sandaracinus amylolyticus]
MKPAEARRLAVEHTIVDLGHAAEALAEELDPPFRVEGDDHGEKLTHVLLAQRIRERIDGGEDVKDAFRHVMAGVRGVLTNE